VAENRIEVVGFDELIEGSYELADKIGSSAQEQFGRTAERVADQVQAIVPRLSGALAASVVAGEEGGRPLVGIGGADVPYAGWIEFGGTRGRPYVREGRYLYPAALAVEDELTTAAETTARDEIGRYRWETPSK
jgi:Bacteriophage HK97-gp10, putative tail-component